MGSSASISVGPLVSICMPLFNEGRFVRSALEALIGQTYRNIEILVSDNCSTDDTWNIVREFAESDPRIKTHRQSSNVGSVKNFLPALQMAQGEFVMLAAGHDLHMPKFVEACVAEMEADPGIVMAYPKADWMNVEGTPIGPIPTNLDTRGMTPLSRVNVTLWGLGYAYQMYGLFRKELFADYEPRTILFPDGYFLVKSAIRGTFAQVPATLFAMRQNADFGDLKAHVGKLFENGAIPSTSSPLQMYYESMAEFIEMVKAGFPPGIERNAAILSVVLSFITWHRHVGLISRAASGSDLSDGHFGLEEIIARYAIEIEKVISSNGNVEELLKKSTAAQALNLLSTDELVCMMSYREIFCGLFNRFKRGVMRMPQAIIKKGRTLC